MQKKRNFFEFSMSFLLKNSIFIQGTRFLFLYAHIISGMKKRLLGFLALGLGMLFFAFPNKTQAWWPYYDPSDHEPASYFGWLSSAASYTQEGFCDLKSFEDPSGTFTQTITFDNLTMETAKYYFVAVMDENGNPIDAPTFRFNEAEFSPIIRPYAGFEPFEDYVDIDAMDSHHDKFASNFVLLSSGMALTEHEITLGPSESIYSFYVKGDAVYVDAAECAYATYRGESQGTEVQFYPGDGGVFHCYTIGGTFDKLKKLPNLISHTTKDATIEDFVHRVATNQSWNEQYARLVMATESISNHFVFNWALKSLRHYDLAPRSLVYEAEMSLYHHGENKDTLIVSRQGRLRNTSQHSYTIDDVEMAEFMYWTASMSDAKMLTLSFREHATVDYYSSAGVGEDCGLVFTSSGARSLIRLVPGKREPIPIEPVVPQSMTGDIFSGVISSVFSVICPPLGIFTLLFAATSGGSTSLVIGCSVGLGLVAIGGSTVFLCLRFRRRKR